MKPRRKDGCDYAKFRNPNSSVAIEVISSTKHAKLPSRPPPLRCIQFRRRNTSVKKMTTRRNSYPRLTSYFNKRTSFDSIADPSVFAPTSIAEPTSRFPPTLSKDSLLSPPVSDLLETKLAELAPSSRTHTFLREIGYIGCTAENIAYLCKKDSPVLLPFEIRARHDILFVATVQFEYRKTEDSEFDVFLVIVTKQEINFYEARPIEQDEVDFLSSFSVACPTDCALTCVQTVVSSEKHVCFGSDKGFVFELRLEGRNGAPVLICLNEDLHGEESPVRSLIQDNSKGVLYALHENSAIEVFLCRVDDAGKRIARYRPSEDRTSFVELFPMINPDPNKGQLLAISIDGFLFNFSIDLNPSKNAFQILAKFLTHSSISELRLTHQESCLATALHSDGSNRKLIGVGYLGGLILAVPVSLDGHHSVELWTASRLPSNNREDSVALIKEPIKLDGSVISIQSATDDDNSKLFEELDLGSDEMTQQIFQKGKKFTVLAGSKVIDIRKRCPVESLLEILNVQVPERLDEFFELYGEVETATMAVQLAASRGEECAFQLLLDDSRLSTMLFASEGGTKTSISIPTQAIITYFRRLMDPIWNRSLVKVKREPIWRKEEVKLTGIVSMMLLEWFESSLLEFHGFLERYIDEHQGIKFHDGTVVAPRCPAVLSEFETLFELKDLVNKCKEMIQLVQIFEENKPVLLDPQLMKILEKTPFSTLAMSNADSENPLIQFMRSIPSEKESEIQEAINFRLDNELPTLSGTKDKIITKALNLLSKAKSSPRPERQEKMIQKAMSLLDDQCDERHIDTIVANLTELQRHYEVLQFVSRTAKKLVPELPTHDPEVQKKASNLRQRVYNRAFDYVDNYIKNIETDDASTDIPVLFGAVQCLNDPHMTKMMMEKLLNSNKIPTSVLHQPSYKDFGTSLRKHLTKKLMDVSKSLESGSSEEISISEASVKEMRLLVEICQSHGDFKMAGDWLMIIAKRLPEKGKKIALIERIGDLNDARAMYDSAMSETFLKSIEKEIEIGMFQHRVLTVGRRIFAIMEDRQDNEEDVKNVLTKLASPELLSRVIGERFPPQIGQDLSEELRRIVGDNNGYESDSTAVQH